MKPEPLKNKTTDRVREDDIGDFRVIRPSSVKSAVEWLKEEILDIGVYEIGVKGTKIGLVDVKEVFNSIDQAFEDVNKNTHNEHKGWYYQNIK